MATYGDDNHPWQDAGKALLVGTIFGTIFILLPALTLKWGVGILCDKNIVTCAPMPQHKQ